MKPSVYYSKLALPSSEMWIDIAFRCVCGRCNASDIDGCVRFFLVTEYYVKEKRTGGRSTVAARLFSIEPAINSHSASTGKLQKRDGSVPAKTFPCMKHGKFECDFKWKNNAQQFRLKNKNVICHTNENLHFLISIWVQHPKQLQYLGIHTMVLMVSTTILKRKKNFFKRGRKIFSLSSRIV